MRLRLGTRGSLLAITQSRWVASRLEETRGLKVELEVIRTSGDVQQDRPLSEIGGKGLFTKELDLALLDGKIDLAVHSLKDLPTCLPEGVSIGAISEREDPRDVLIGPPGTLVTLDSLAEGARVGSSSLRRAALLRATRPDIKIRDIRGNLDTRIRKLERGEVDAIVVAAAGVCRLGWSDRVSEYLDPGSWLPAPGQGALGIVVRTEELNQVPWLRSLDHLPSRVATTAERTLLEVLGAGCRLPVAALGLPFGGGLRLKGMVAHPDGTLLIRAEGTGTQDDPSSLGEIVGGKLLDQGANLLLDELRVGEAIGG